MSQPGPPADAMRVAANHGSFVAVRVRGAGEDVAARVAGVLAELGLQPAEKLGSGRRTSFRQDPAPMTEVVVFPARSRWVLVVPGTHDEELLAVLGARLAGRNEVLAVTWHRATDYHRIHRYFGGRLTRHVGVYAGELLRSFGERLPGEEWDEGDFRSRLVDAPGELEAWLLQRELDPGRDRTGVDRDEESMSVIRVGARPQRAEILRRYLDEVDPGFEPAQEELQRLAPTTPPAPSAP